MSHHFLCKMRHDGCPFGARLHSWVSTRTRLMRSWGLGGGPASYKWLGLEMPVDPALLAGSRGFNAGAVSFWPINLAWVRDSGFGSWDRVFLQQVESLGLWSPTPLQPHLQLPPHAHLSWCPARLLPAGSPTQTGGQRYSEGWPEGDRRAGRRPGAVPETHVRAAATNRALPGPHTGCREGRRGCYLGCGRIDKGSGSGGG